MRCPKTSTTGRDRRRASDEGLSALAKERVERDEEDLVRLYLTDIGQYPLLTKDDEVRLAQTIEAGRAAELELATKPKDLTAAKRRELRRKIQTGEQAQQTFVQSNLRLVVSIAKKYQASGLPLLDLIQEGNLGLMHAVEKFDWRKGLQVLDLRHLVDPSGHHPGHRQHRPDDPAPGARRRHARPRAEGAGPSRAEARPPATLAELGAEVEMPEDKLIEALRFRAEPLSLSEPLREDGDAELGDVVEDRSAESPFEVAATVAAARRDQPAAFAARRARARDPPPAFRSRPGRAADARGGRRALQPDPGAHPPDRGAGHVEAPSSVVGHRRKGSAHGLSSSPARRGRDRPGQTGRRQRAAPGIGSAREETDGPRPPRRSGPHRRQAATRSLSHPTGGPPCARAADEHRSTRGGERQHL